jgi:hypothetical protein
LTALLERSPNVKILTEFWPEGLTACGTSPAAYLQMLTRLGFDLYTIGDEAGRLKPSAPDALLARSNLASGGHVNLLCSRDPVDA